MLKKRGPRLEKISEEVKKEVSSLIHYELADPRVEGIQVTGVKMSLDLSFARVYFTLSEGSSKKKEALAVLKRASGWIRHQVSERINLKFAPQFDFFYDDSLEIQATVDSLFEQLVQGPQKRQTP